MLPSQKEALETLRGELNEAAAAATGEDTESKLMQARQLSAEQLTKADVLLPPIRNIKDLQQIIYENLQAAMLDEKTVDEAIADAAADWNRG